MHFWGYPPFRLKGGQRDGCYVQSLLLVKDIVRHLLFNNDRLDGLFNKLL